MATESFGRNFEPAPGWGERAMLRALEHPTLKNDSPAPAPLHKMTEEEIRKFRERYGIKN